MLNGSSSQWMLFKNSSYFYYPFKSDLTIKEDLFRDFDYQIIWKIELVVYSPSQNSSGSSSMIFYVNFPPRNGSCKINPRNGTTNTLFEINCYGWIDLDGSVASYSYYGKSFFIFPKIRNITSLFFK